MNDVTQRSAYTVSGTATRISTEVGNRVLRNTYALLAMLFVTMAGTAAVGAAMNWRLPFLVFLVGIFAFSYLIAKTRNSAVGVAVAFGFAAFLGLFTGMTVDYTMARFANGGALVVTAFSMTAALFLGLSGYAMTTRRDFSTWGAMIMTGWIVVLIAVVVNLFLKLPALGLAIASIGSLLAAAGIVWKTQLMVRGGETNYILVATGLLADIFVLFNNLLHLLGFGFGDD